jgi:hypothetical protein
MVGTVDSISSNQANHEEDGVLIGIFEIVVTQWFHRDFVDRDELGVTLSHGDNRRSGDQTIASASWGLKIPELQRSTRQQQYITL